MKKIVALVLAMTMILALAACGNTSQSASDSGAETKDAVVDESAAAQAESAAGEIEAVEGAIQLDNGVTYYTQEWYRGTVGVYEAETTGYCPVQDPTHLYTACPTICACDTKERSMESCWCDNVYETLVMRDPDTQELKPLLATEWEFTGTEFKATLREGVKFHDGTDMDAEDVLFTFQRCANTKGHRAKSVCSKIDFDKSTFDGYTIDIIFKEECPAFMNYVVSVYMGIMSKDYFDVNGEEAELLDSDAGTGAYYLVETITGNSQTFERFDDWWGSTADWWGQCSPQIKTVTAINYKDLTALGIDFENGDVGIAVVSDGVVYQNMLDGYYTDCTLYNLPNHRLINMVPATIGGKVLADDNIREAINLAIDREALNTTVFGENGEGSVPTRIVLSGEDIGASEYDIEKAKSLMEAAGYNDSNHLSLRLVNSNATDNILAAENVQFQLSKIYIDVEINTVTSSAFNTASNDTVVPSEWDLILGTASYTADCALDYSGHVAYGKEVGDYSAVKGRDDQEYCELIESLDTAKTIEERDEISSKLQKMLMDKNYSYSLSAKNGPAMCWNCYTNIHFLSGYHFYWAAIEINSEY